MTQRYAITIAYDGTRFHGWQRQPQHRTVQQDLEEALEKLSGAFVRVHSSSRTDTGVHARGQVAHFDLNRRWESRRLRLAINSLIEPDVRVMAVKAVKPDFHARYECTGKIYRYHIYNGLVLPPDLRHYRAHVVRPLDAQRMRAAAAHLVGTHDFAAFSANPNREIETTVRTLRRLDVLKQGPEIRLTAEGDGFLYRMVRSLAGFLIRVGGGEVEPETAAEILASKVRTARVPTAPAQGLFLWKMQFPNSRGAGERSARG